jgi:hypothetical protein
VEAERSNLLPAERTCWPAGLPTAAVRMFELPQQGFTSGVSNCTMAPWLDKLPRMGKLVLSGYGRAGHSVTLSVAPTVLLTPGCYQSGDVVLSACCLGAGTATYRTVITGISTRRASSAASSTRLTRFSGRGGNGHQETKEDMRTHRPKAGALYLRPVGQLV